MILIHGLIYLITSLAAGSLIIGIAAGQINIDTISKVIDTFFFADRLSPWLWSGIGILILLSCLQFISRLFKNVRREKFITRQTAEGQVSISLNAIEDMIRKILEDKEELSHIKPKVTFTRKGINILVRGYLTSEVNLIEFTSDIQEIIKKKITYLLGEDEVLKINLEIKKLAFAASRDVVEDEPRVPFRNY